MGDVYFYHLTRRPMLDTLRMLAGKSRDNGWNVVVRGTDAGVLAQVDTALWTTPEDSFLPHGIAGGEYDADQPILLTTGNDIPNNAACLICINGAGPLDDEPSQLERVCILFDGNDDAALNHARGQWKAIKDAGQSAQYWSEESGKWEKKAET